MLRLKRTCPSVLLWCEGLHQQFVSINIKGWGPRVCLANHSLSYGQALGHGTGVMYASGI
jgi:hypothetical protein